VDTGTPCRSKGGYCKLTEVSKVEVAGLSNEKATEILETRLPSSEPIWREFPLSGFRFIGV